MKQSIKVSAVMILAGTSLDMSKIQSHIPQTHRKATADVVANYIHGKFYNPMKSTKDWDRSEARKQQILQNIAFIHKQIRVKADLLQRDQVASKMLETIACTMENRTRNRDHQLRTERAKQLRIPAKYISADVLRQRKGMPVIEI